MLMKTLCKALLLAALLGTTSVATIAAAQTKEDGKPSAASTPSRSKPSTAHSFSFDPKNPRLAVVDKKQIVVNQEPIFFSKRQKSVRVTWHVPINTKYRFGKDGITFDKSAADEIVDCRPEKGGRVFSCLNKNTKPGSYKYTIALEGEPKIKPLDPALVNGHD
jgi:hypothetical protein